MNGYSKRSERMISTRRACLDECDGSDWMISDRRKRSKTNGARCAVLFGGEKCGAANDAEGGRRMRIHREIVKLIAKLGVLLVIITNLSACVGLAGTSWREEVLQHDGSKLVVSRSVSRGGQHEIGQRPPIKTQGLDFTIPKTDEKVSWEDNFTEDVGGANFLPMQLEILHDTAYLVAYPMGCMSYNKWGRPNPPYVVFRYQAKAWKRISLSELPTELISPNMIFSDPDGQVERLEKGFITAEIVRRIIGGYRQPEYQTILREPIQSAGEDCPEMIRVKDGWEGTGFFSGQPSNEACLKYCMQKEVSIQNCPCNRFFRAK